MEPWRTPAIIGKNVEDWPLSNTHWYLSLRNLSINFYRGPDIAIDLIYKSDLHARLCQMP